jgi:hypothetical protein
MRCILLTVFAVILAVGCHEQDPDKTTTTQRTPAAAPADDPVVFLDGQPVGHLSGAPLKLSEPPPDYKGPWLGDVAVRKAQAAPLRLDFSIRIRRGKEDFDFDAKESLWVCLGTPKGSPSFRDTLHKAISPSPFGDDFRRTVRGEIAASSVDFFDCLAAFNMPAKDKKEVTRCLVGYGFLSFVAHDLVKGTDGWWLASISVPAREYPGDEVKFSAPTSDGNPLDVTYSANELPVSWVLFDPLIDRLSNERRAVLDLKAGKLLRVITDDQ